MARRETCDGCGQGVELDGNGRCPRCLTRRGQAAPDATARQHVLTYRAGGRSGDPAAAFAEEQEALARAGWLVAALAYGGAQPRAWARQSPGVLTVVYRRERPEAPPPGGRPVGVALRAEDMGLPPGTPLYGPGA